jgi:hypothetical protein
MKEKFIDRKFTSSSLEKINLVNGIIEQYAAQDFDLSLRQLYYQMVARGYIPNNQREYKNLGSLVSDARQAGMIDWEYIQDRGRDTVIPAHWDSPAEIVRAAASQFKIDKWENQYYHLEVMVEKDALSGVLEPTCRRLDISLSANKGYTSSSAIYVIANRLADKIDRGKEVVIFYLGDHDPSGLDMTRDVLERLSLYSREHIEVNRLALNYDQIEDLNPPENPAKETDARYAGYVAEYGESSWELDAIEPAALARLVEDAVENYRDDDIWDKAVAREEAIKAQLRDFVKTYKPPSGE